MSLANLIKRNLSSFSRSKQKSNVVQSVLKAEQSNTDLINLHRIDPSNVGDFYCGPHQYFDRLRDKELDIFDYKSSDKLIVNNWIKKVSKNALIIGGGGLLNRGSFELQMQLFEKLGASDKKTVLWGVGHNEKDEARFNKVSSYNVNTENFGLVGVRDYSMQENWVPCVSCLHPIFDESYEEKTGNRHCFS